MSYKKQSELVPRQVALQKAKDKLRFYLRNAKAPNTVRTYLSNWKQFEDWCREQGLRSMPADPSTLALFLSQDADEVSSSTLRLRLTAVSKIHELSGHESPAKDPLVRSTWEGIKRMKGVMQVGKAPLLTDDIVAMVHALPDTLQGIRDRALLLVGFAGCFRRSEITALRLEDVRFVKEGLVVVVKRSKTDQSGEGYKKGIPYGQTAACPVKALQLWIECAGLDSGPLFRKIDRHGNIGENPLSGNAIALIVKRTALAAGLDAADYAGHSLRSGLATQAAISGVDEASIVRQGGWKTERMARRYVRDGSLFRDNAASKVGL